MKFSFPDGNRSNMTGALQADTSRTEVSKVVTA